MVRDYKESDLKAIRSLHERSFNFPDLSRCHDIIVSVNDDNICGAAVVKVASEAIFMINENLPRKTRALTAKELAETGIYRCQKLGFDQLHAFLTGQDAHSWANILKKRYGFVDITGIPLVLNL